MVKFFPKRYDKKHVREAIVRMDDGTEMKVFVYFTYRNIYSSVIIDDYYIVDENGKGVDEDRIVEIIALY